MKNIVLFLITLIISGSVFAQSPTVKNWLINTTGITGKHYVNGNSTPIEDTAKANVQLVRYSDDYVYVNSSGIPAYTVGPYLDGNPALATNNNWLFKFPQNPTENTGNRTETPLGPIGVFINGVPIYDYKDAASYNSSTRSDDMRNGDGVWNRNAIAAENDGFDCAKGHPSPIFSGGRPGQGTLEGGSYHHHQNPMAFNLDLVEVSDVCDLYLADGLYNLDSTVHSPLIGFAFDGYPIYGGYGYADPNDANSAIKRMESSYQERDITVRTHYADGTDVTDGPDVNNDYPIGWYREDYEFKSGSGDLDEHNGRFCKTPEYPNGTYAYFATVDKNWNSAFPYVIGIEYYGVVETSNFVGRGGSNVEITEEVEVYTPVSVNEVESEIKVGVYPNPSAEFLAIQINGLIESDLRASLYNLEGKLIKQTTINQGSTIWYLDTRTIYAGEYLLIIEGAGYKVDKKVIITH
jgi:hypothetical protein